MEKTDLINVKEASIFATKFLGKNVTESNINYLIQYGRILKYNVEGRGFISKNELENYYKSFLEKRHVEWSKKLGDEVNWLLSFEKYKESETTKHVHKLHPYKGKFIPQLAEYFLDEHIDDFKKDAFFKAGDIILDPFSGSGTTMIQGNELGMHVIGIDISEFNAFIANCKVMKLNINKLKSQLDGLTIKLEDFVTKSNISEFEESLAKELQEFNNEFFPIPDFKYKVRHRQVDEDSYGREKSKMFMEKYNRLVKEFDIKLKQTQVDTFIDRWYFPNVKDEIYFIFDEIKKIEEVNVKMLCALVLSRTIRSCRATTHADLATLKEPVNTTYYCSKHGKMCKPLFSILKWWKSYCKDTIKRLKEFDSLRTETVQVCLNGDSRNIDIIGEISKKTQLFAEVLEEKKIKGIFSSPPYVGLIDYHQQHAYAYELFGFERKDDLEIGPLFKGKGKEAKQNYVEGISSVLNNCKKYMVEDFDVFLVANDKYNLYPTIAERSGMRVVNQYRRPVLNRTEKDKGAYSEIIFHLKSK